MRIKSELDRRVASSLGIRVREVARTTDEFINELVAAIVEDGGFHIVGLGKLKVKFEKGTANLPRGQECPMRIKIYFRKSITLKRLIERKFGVHKEKSK